MYIDQRCNVDICVCVLEMGFPPLPELYTRYINETPSFDELGTHHSVRKQPYNIHSTNMSFDTLFYYRSEFLESYKHTGVFQTLQIYHDTLLYSNSKSV